MKVYVIIVTYNGSKWIKKCIDSALNATIPLNIVVIDNCSNDGTLEQLNLYTSIKVFQSLKNLGFGKANNIGIRYAIVEMQADYVFLLNQDAYLEPNTVEELIRIHKLNSNFGIVSPIHLNGMGTAMDFNFSQACNAIHCPGFLSDSYLKNLKDIYPLNFVMAAMWLIPRQVVLEVGLFDPIFPHYGEDVDYVQRAVNFGYKIGICPNTVGYHDRENRVDSVQKVILLRYLEYICTLKNNNRSLLVSFSAFTKRWVKSMLVFLYKKEFKYFSIELLNGFQIMLLTPKIINNRKYCRNRPAFLN